MTREFIKYVIIAIVGLGLALISVPAFSADVTGKTSTQTLPTQTNTQTAPLPSNTQTVPLPSTTREYQQVDKPPVKKLDIPDYDLAGQLRIVRVDSRRNSVAIHFKVALMNKGKQRVNNENDVQIWVRLINVIDQTACGGYQYTWSGHNIEHVYWELETNEHVISFRPDHLGAPSTINDVKMIVDIDPNNTFGEARNDRENNRCVVTTW